MRRLWLILALLGVLALGWGVKKGDYQTVKRWSNTLCTSCIGLIDKESHR
ncbi:MAG: hypothetical protein J7M26_02820 [Armatimonadetes bacterium]|nr:hypothetical protein [Armatimonadota bacterium]